MEVSLRVVVTATVLLMVAVIVSFLLTDKAILFGNTHDDEVKGSICDLEKQERRQAFCNDGASAAARIETEAREEHGCEPSTWPDTSSIEC